MLAINPLDLAVLYWDIIIYTSNILNEDNSLIKLFIGLNGKEDNIPIEINIKNLQCRQYHNVFSIFNSAIYVPIREYNEYNYYGLFYDLVTNILTIREYPSKLIYFQERQTWDKEQVIATKKSSLLNIITKIYNIKQIIKAIKSKGFKPQKLKNLLPMQLKLKKKIQIYNMI